MQRARPVAAIETDEAHDGGNEAVNGIIELHRRLAKGLRNQHNHLLRMLLALSNDSHQKMSEEPVSRRLRMSPRVRTAARPPG